MQYIFGIVLGPEGLSWDTNYSLSLAQEIEGGASRTSSALNILVHPSFKRKPLTMTTKFHVLNYFSCKTYQTYDNNV